MVQEKNYVVSRHYDYCIVGAGPCGLTLAWYLAKTGKKVLLLEREKTIGGCHRVRRVSGKFTEHGPRIYLNNYNSFKKLLLEMGSNFNDLFVKYDFSISSIGGKTLSNFSFKELSIFLFYAGLFLFNPGKLTKITVDEFTRKYNFSESSRNYLDRLCRLTDGAGIDRYTLYELFQLVNQTSFYGIYQPKLPTDEGIFKIWEDALVSTGNVTIRTEIEVKKIIYNNNNLPTGVLSQNNEYFKGKKIILAVPPLNISTLNLFPEIINFSQDTKYDTYVSVTFHWNHKIPLKKEWGFKNSRWGIIFIVLSDYFQNDNKTLISTAITRLNTPSLHTGKTANESNFEELQAEIWTELNEVLSVNAQLPVPNDVILSPGVYRYNGEWKSVDTAFMFTKYGYMHSFQLRPNVYTCGTHTGQSQIAFTSMESAMENAVNLVNLLEPSLELDIGGLLTIKHVLLFLLVIIIVIVLIIQYKS